MKVYELEVKQTRTVKVIVRLGNDQDPTHFTGATLAHMIDNDPTAEHQVTRTELSEVMELVPKTIGPVT